MNEKQYLIEKLLYDDFLIEREKEHNKIKEEAEKKKSIELYRKNLCKYYHIKWYSYRRIEKETWVNRQTAWNYIHEDI